MRRATDGAAVRYLFTDPWLIGGLAIVAVLLAFLMVAVIVGRESEESRR